MNNKKVYEKGLELVKAANQMYDALENIGINIDFDNQTKLFSGAYLKMMQNPKEIVCEALGLKLKEESGFCEGVDAAHLFPVTMYTYYPDNDDVKFSITDEFMMDLIDKAAENSMCAERVWECFAEKSFDAKECLIEDYDVEGFAEIKEEA